MHHFLSSHKFNILACSIKHKTLHPSLIPLISHPGRFEFFVDCSANATPEFEGRGGEALATEMGRTLSHAYSDKNVFDLTSLLILSGRHYWILYIDILVRNAVLYD